MKLLTLALFAYVGTVFVVRVPWGEVLYRTVLPSVSFVISRRLKVFGWLATTVMALAVIAMVAGWIAP